MRFSDINPKDPRWTLEQSMLLHRLFIKKDQYMNQGRAGEHHAMRQAILITVATFLDNEYQAPTDWGDI